MHGQPSVRRYVRSWHRTLAAGFAVILVGVTWALAAAGRSNEMGNITTLPAVILVSVGGSMIASGLVARLVATQVLGIDVREAIEALHSTSKFARSEQSVEITLSPQRDRVTIIAKHEFDVTARTTFPRTLPVTIYTDLSSAGGGFESVEVDDTAISGAELQNNVDIVQGKAQFSRRFFFNPGKKRHLVVVTYGEFQAVDRLIWTVEHISRDFSVRIYDHRMPIGTLDVKINHHRGGEVEVKPRRIASGTEIAFSFPGGVLPFQGFELRWGRVTPSTNSD